LLSVWIKAGNGNSATVGKKAVNLNQAYMQEDKPPLELLEEDESQWQCKSRLLQQLSILPLSINFLMWMLSILGTATAEPSRLSPIFINT